MTKEDKIETKTKIITAARDLFSRSGFDGTSVRQIAEKSGVNIAAINYHFKTKHGLYWAIIDEAHLWLEEGIRDIVSEAQDMEELTRSIFRFMRSGETYIRSTMKTMLTEGVPEFDDADHSCGKDENFGPPGGEYVFKFLKNRYAEGIDDRAIHWAVFSIFSSLFHWATMCSSTSFKEKTKAVEHLGEKQIEDSIVHTTKAVLAYMTENTDW